MPRRFAEIAFTPSVKAVQSRNGTRAANEKFEQADDPRDTLTAREAEFIAGRDSFYMATVAENGWPYVQHRGGPAGFLRVLDEKTIGFADFRGNMQYLSVGNVEADGRVSLILVDYPNRRRLKLWGRARVVEAEREPELLARLEDPAYRARVERGMLVTVEAIEWNCPQHITPRYTEAELAGALGLMRARLTELEEENRRLRAANASGAMDVSGESVR